MITLGGVGKGILGGCVRNDKGGGTLRERGQSNLQGTTKGGGNHHPQMTDTKKKDQVGNRRWL